MGDGLALVLFAPQTGPRRFRREAFVFKEEERTCSSYGIILLEFGDRYHLKKDLSEWKSVAWSCRSLAA